MKKLFLGAVLTAGLMSSVVAQGLFVGAEGDYIIKSKVQATNTQYDASTLTYDKSTLTIDDSLFGLGFKFGYDFDKAKIYTKLSATNKLKDEIIVNGIKSDVEMSFYNFVIGADFTPQVNQDIKFLIGIYSGIEIANYKITANQTNVYILSEDTDTAYIYGVRIGGIYSFNDHNEIEIGLNLDQSKYTKTTEKYINAGVLQEDDKADTKRSGVGIFVGYNYKF